ncbi:hypothetical protein ACF08M_32065 [Streptomyces sp. NPDC015032]|uniref:hypothetical protein n=1 Tax=Streptomyces sp. NPDC015032 TaxID=3364937 RepID=UPI0036F79C2E
MSTVASWPPLAKDTRAVVEAYDRVLGWLLITDTTIVSQGQAVHEMTERPDTLLSTPCSAFDAVKVPYEVGMESMVLFGRRDVGPVPCLIERKNHVILLVRAGTGQPLSDLADGVSVEAGSGGRLVLPPSAGHRWDTPPWAITSEDPCQLPDGAALVPCLVDALRLFGSPRPADPGTSRASARCSQGFSPPPTIRPAGLGSS